MYSTQEVDLSKAVSMQNVNSGNINERFSSTHYAKLMQFSPAEAQKYIAQFQTQTEESITEEVSEAPTNFQPVDKPIEEDIVILIPKAEEISLNSMTDDEEKEVLVAQLRKAGMKLASTKWKLETLRSKAALLS